MSNKKLKLLIFGLNYAPEMVGIGKYSGEMAAWFASRGHEVEAIMAPPFYPQWKLPDDVSGSFERQVVDGVKVERAPLWLPKGRVSAKARILLETSYNAAAVRYWLPRLLKRRRPDAIIVVTPPLQLALPALAYRALTGVPVIIHVQDLQVDAALQLGMLPQSLSFLARGEQRILAAADRVCTISEAMRARIVDKGVDAEKVGLMRNWADEELLNSEASSPPEEGPIKVLYCGNMGNKQGLEIVLDAAERLADRDDIEFVLAGDGVARKPLQAEAEARKLENLNFLPPQDSESFWKLLRSAHIHLVIQKRSAADLVMPSKLTNIMAVGGACIATADPGTEIGRVFASAECGQLVEPEHAAELATAIAELAENHARRKSLAARAHRYARSHLARGPILSAVESELRDLGG